MVFSSIEFLCYFLPPVLLFYYALPRLRNGLLLGASLVFYAWGELVYLPVLLVSVVVNYFAAARIGSTSRRRAYLVLGLLVNLGVLVFFKYIGFVSTNIHSLTGRYIPGAWRFCHIPLGISFFTFQAMSYLVDVYRGDARAERRFTSVALYITMFPQLIAGPIVRFKDIVDELHSRALRLDQVAAGARLLVLGLASKVLLANSLAVPADAAFGMDAGQLSADIAWLGLLCYALQIYFDFAGYSWMAIGLGRMLGFTFPQNFKLPYLADSITDFWRRWHISLSTWFRDYLYIPLGGSRHGVLRTYRNLVIVFLLCGLWHGANWTFVVWGIYHGIFLIAERSNARLRSVFPWCFRHAYALAVTLGGWLLFRSDSLTHAGQYLRAMFTAGSTLAAQRTAASYISPDVALALLVAIPLSGACGPAPGACRHLFKTKTIEALRWGRSVGIIALLVVCLATLASGTHNPFIYFNF